MIAPNQAPARSFPRTRQRLGDAQQAIYAGQYTAAVMLIRNAIDTSMREAFGKACDQTAFLNLLTVEAGGSPKTIKRIRRLRDAANAVVHGVRNGRRREAEQMLRLFHTVGCRWLRRFHGVTLTGIQADATPEELRV